MQDEFNGVYGALKKYKPKKEPYIEKRRKLLINADSFCKGREMIIDAFKNKIFSLVPTGFSEDDEPPRDKDKEEEKNSRLPTIEEALEKIVAIDYILESGLVKKYFKNDFLTDMFEQLRSLMKNQSKISAKKIKMLLIEAGLEKLKNDRKNMSENKIRNKRLNVLASFIEEVLIVDRMNDMLDLETEEAAQRGQELKILTPKQMITRLPILLAQLKAGNNSQKLKNQIRQLLHHLYRSKNLRKPI